MTPPNTPRPAIKLNPLANAKVPLAQAIQMLHVPGNLSPQAAIAQAAWGPAQNLSK
jgi:hypothetical protein